MKPGQAVISGEKVSYVLPMRGCSVASHISYKTYDNHGALILRGVDLSTATAKSLYRLTFCGKVVVHTDEEIHPWSIIGTETSGHDEIRLMTVNDGSLVSRCTGHLPHRDDTMLEIHRDSLMTRNMFYTQITQFDISQSTGTIKAVSMKTLENLTVSIPVSAMHQPRVPRPQYVSPTPPLLLSLTRQVKLVTMAGRDSVAMVDFRDRNSGACEWILRKDGYDYHEGYRTGVKANCKAYLWTERGMMVQIDRGTITDRILLPSKVPARPQGSFEDVDGIPFHYDNLRDAHALSDVSPTVALLDEQLGATRLYDVKREHLLASIDDDHWTSTVPLFVTGIPQLVGVNKITSQLEIVA